MFKKLRLKRLIKQCKKSIVALEKKRARSQAALVDAILTNTIPADEDVDYFNHFTGKINEIRDQMHEYQKELEQL